MTTHIVVDVITDAEIDSKDIGSIVEYLRGLIPQSVIHITKKNID